MNTLTLDEMVLIGAIIVIFSFTFLIGFAIWFIFFDKYDNTKKITDEAIRDTNGYV